MQGISDIVGGTEFSNYILNEAKITQFKLSCMFEIDVEETSLTSLIH